MRTKTLLPLLLAGTMFVGTAFGQTSEMTGKVVAVSPTAITLQKGAEVWNIKRGSSTSVNGTLNVGSTVTVKYAPANAQKKEGPTAASDNDPENTALGAQKKE